MSTGSNYQLGGSRARSLSLNSWTITRSGLFVPEDGPPGVLRRQGWCPVGPSGGCYRRLSSSFPLSPNLRALKNLA